MEDFKYGMKMEWKKIASMDYGKIIFHSKPCTEFLGNCSGKVSLSSSVLRLHRNDNSLLRSNKSELRKVVYVFMLLLEKTQMLIHILLFFDIIGGK